MENNWIGYFVRTASQIREATLVYMRTLLPEITDHSTANPLVRFLQVWAGIAETLHYYIDKEARESHLVTSRLWKSMVNHARAHDYAIRPRIAATGEISFELDNPAPSIVTIPIGTVVETADGVKCLTLEQGDIAIGASKVTLPAIQVEVLSYAQTLQGSIYELTEQSIAGNYPTVADINGNPIVWKSSLYDSANSDYVARLTVNEDRKVVIEFGDGNAGRLPVSGETLNVTYPSTTGIASFAAGVFNVIDTVIAVPPGYILSAVNEEPFTGGKEIEDIESVRTNIPKYIRTILRGVTRQDVVLVAELADGVAKAGQSFDCGFGLKVYIVPNGGGVATNPLLASVKTWMDDHVILSLDTQVFTTGIVEVVIEFDVRVRSQYSRSATGLAVSNALLAYFDYQNQEINGSLYESDLYAVVEGVAGVLNSTLRGIYIRPFAAKRLQSDADIAWTFSVDPLFFPTTGFFAYELRFTSPTTFAVLKNNVFVASATVGIAFTLLPEIQFTVVGGFYLGTESYSFRLYPRDFSELQLSEPSLFALNLSDITLNLTGGN